MSDTAVNHYLAEHTRQQSFAIPSWLKDRQDNAIQLFKETGFPTTRQEEWKYTDVRSIMKRGFIVNPDQPDHPDTSAVDKAKFVELNCQEIIFINGCYIPDMSVTNGLPTGVIFEPLSETINKHPNIIEEHLTRYASPDKNGFAALNTAFIRDGFMLYLPEDTVLSRPINIIYLSSQHVQSYVYNFRNLIILSKNSSATVIETYSGEDNVEYFTNTVTEVDLGSGSTLEHYKLQHEGPGAYHVGDLQVQQKRDSRLLSHSISLGGRLARNDIDIKLAEPGAETTLNGLYIAGQKQHIDNHTRIDHLSPHTVSKENYRGILSGRARGVFNGKVVVHKDAQKTDAQQSNANLLLSKNAEVDTKPELEIYADDVKCSHGATIGQLDDNMLYYLRTRAIDVDTAKSLLTFAFAEDVINQIQLEPIRHRLEQVVVGKLPDANIIRDFIQ